MNLNDSGLPGEWFPGKHALLIRSFIVEAINRHQHFIGTDQFIANPRAHIDGYTINMGQAAGHTAALADVLRTTRPDRFVVIGPSSHMLRALMWEVTGERVERRCKNTLVWNDHYSPSQLIPRDALGPMISAPGAFVVTDSIPVRGRHYDTPHSDRTVINNRIFELSQGRAPVIHLG